jgi:NADP-dependent 3-hydroxy acid dehydrogenase YdfG
MRRFMSNNLDGKLLVITGASSGLVETVARALAQQGA